MRKQIQTVVVTLAAAQLASCGMMRSPAPSRQPLAVLDDHPFPATFFRDHGVNPTVETRAAPVSTFSVDVDTASYSLARGYLDRGAMPVADGVRVEEFINAFDYGYAAPEQAPFAVDAEVAPSPSRPGWHVLRIGLKGREVERVDRLPSNLVFVVDVSGSMNREDRLGLVKRALHLLLDELDERDRVGIVVYGSRARVVIEPTPATERARILAALSSLEPGGSTNAEEGIALGYQMAAEHLVPGGINRIVLCSDGVANAGVTDADDIFDRVREEAARGISISTVGFGLASYHDALMERLAQRGDGNYAYVDRLGEAHRVFVENLTGTMQLIARDVKVQLELDPDAVARYRLIGYENRLLARRDFEDDRVDAGDVGAGQSVTALYEVQLSPGQGALGVLRLRYRDPAGGASRLFEARLARGSIRDRLEESTAAMRLALTAATFAERLRGSPWLGAFGYGDMLSLAATLEGPLAEGEQVQELRRLIEVAARIDHRAPSRPEPDLQVLSN